MIDIDEANTELSRLRPNSEQAKDLTEQVQVAMATQSFIAEVRTLLVAALTDDPPIGQVTQGVRVAADTLTWHSDETLMVILRPEDFEWVVSIHRHHPSIADPDKMWDMEGWVAYTGLKCPGYFPFELVAPASAVADYLFQLIRRIR